MTSAELKLRAFHRLKLAYLSSCEYERWSTNLVPPLVVCEVEVGHDVVLLGMSQLSRFFR